MRGWVLWAFGLMYCAAPAVAADDAFEKLGALRYGATVAETERDLAGLCESRRTRRIDPPFLDSVKREQFQIDCEGFVFRGKPRHAELVFRDNSLEMAWIMVEPAEQGAILAAMIAAFGQPSHRTGRYVAFAGADAAWRFKPAEVLFYSPALGASEVEGWFASH